MGDSCDGASVGSHRGNWCVDIIGGITAHDRHGCGGSVSSNSRETV